MRRGWWVEEKKQMVLMLITITMMLQFQMKGCVGCVESERMGLLQLKSYFKNLDGVNLTHLKSWTHNGDCCQWKRVKCSDTTGHIVHLSLDGLVFVEYFSPGPLNLSLLHSFPELKTLNVSSNWFSHLFDPIHGYKSFQRLEKLTTLDLSYNELNNSVLPFLSAARSLRTLNLAGNSLEGVFPPYELGNMTELRVLNVYNNRFNFFSAKGLINLRDLEELDLSGNSIYDSEAGDVLRTTQLKTLDLSNNNFSDTLRVTGLDFPLSLEVLNLQKNQLSLTPKGYSKICKLVYLQELDLSLNALTNFPYCLRYLKHLRTLDLSDNQLNGDLSSFVYGLPLALEYLSLLDNHFNGSFLFKSLVNHTSLRVFRLSSKVGMIRVQAERPWVPPFQLKRLKLQNFVLGSTIPGFLFHQYELCFIDLSHNSLTGAFPTWLLQNNTRLHTLLLNDNSLTKLQLPMRVHGLQVLDISSNMIQDSIQQDIGIVFPKLRYMNFSSNSFHGTIPSFMNEMKSLHVLDVSSNGLSGELPKTFLSSCYSLMFLKLSNNQFQGRILLEHANLTNLLWLVLDGNHFNGSLGKGLLNLKTLRLLDISNNSISGTLPNWMGRMSSLWYLNMGGNQLKGPFPSQLQNLYQVEVIDISHNSFSGSIPRNLDFPSLKVLSLQSNEFMGSVPNTLFVADKLQVLDLRSNNFSGIIVNTSSFYSDLRVLLLRNNSFQTHIPEDICQLDDVGLLDLSCNKFQGTIPSCLSKMRFGGVRYFNVRNFATYHWFKDEFVPDWSYPSAFDLDNDFKHVLQLKAATTVNFLTKNRSETYEDYILRQMHGLDLSCNQLSGDIPVDIGDAENIRSLNLSHNHLTGTIPESISKLSNLGSLDLSNNKLHGKIPPQLASLNSLGYLDISHNNLSGEIPFKGQLAAFDENSYIGNAQLCGLPTNISCSSTRASEPSATTNDKEEIEDDGVIDMEWFYWTCIAVFVSTPLILSAFLCIDSPWSRKWFYWVDSFIHRLQCFKDRFLCN